MTPHEQEGTPPADGFELGHGSLPAFILELNHWPLLGPEPAGFQAGNDTLGSSGSQAFGLRLELTPPALLGLPLANCRSGASSDSMVTWASSLFLIY